MFGIHTNGRRGWPVPDIVGPRSMVGALLSGLLAVSCLGPALAQPQGQHSGKWNVVHCHDTERRIVVRVAEPECPGKVVSAAQATEIEAERAERIAAALSGGPSSKRLEAGPDAHEADVAALVRKADSGEAGAQFELAVRYESAIGVARDDGRAMSYFCRAARHGHADAGYRLGWIFAYGRGVPRDDGRAAAWLAWARDRGHPHAGQSLEALGNPRPAGPPGCAVLPSVRRPPGWIADLIGELAPAYGTDPRLVEAIAAVESGFRSDAVSPRNAKGLMQLMPGTAARFGVADVFDTRQNLIGALRYIDWLKERFAGDLELVLAAYNAGEGAVERYGGLPPYAETQAYVRNVLSLYRRE